MLLFTHDWHNGSSLNFILFYPFTYFDTYLPHGVVYNIVMNWTQIISACKYNLVSFYISLKPHSNYLMVLLVHVAKVWFIKDGDLALIYHSYYNKIWQLPVGRHYNSHYNQVSADGRCWGVWQLSCFYLIHS